MRETDRVAGVGGLELGNVGFLKSRPNSLVCQNIKSGWSGEEPALTLRAIRCHALQQSSAGMIVANRDWSGYRQCVRTMTMIKVSAETCDTSRPVLNARAAGRQELPCSASILLPTQLPAQPEPRPVLHETTESCAPAPSLPRSTAEIHASLIPIISLPQIVSQHPDELGLDCVKTRAWQ
jgi:hypothetical protein